MHWASVGLIPQLTKFFLTSTGRMSLKLPSLHPWEETESSIDTKKMSFRSMRPGQRLPCQPWLCIVPTTWQGTWPRSREEQPVIPGMCGPYTFPLWALSGMVSSPLDNPEPSCPPSLFQAPPSLPFPHPLTYWAIPRWECAALGGHRPRCGLLGRTLSSQAGCGL